MTESLPRFRDTSVLVVGDLMLDRYWHGETQRVSPEAPVPVVRVGDIEARPGGAANVAMNLVALGVNAKVRGLVGWDEPGDTLIGLLEGAAVQTAVERIHDRPTVTKLRVISRHQQLLRLDFETPFEGLSDDLEAAQSLLQGHQLLVISDYLKGTLAKVETWIQAARAVSIPVVVDPKGADFQRYRGATLLTPNRTEFEAVVGVCKTEDQLIERAQRLVEHLDLQALLITRGEHGMTLVDAEGQVTRWSAQAKEVYDVTGAGDTVVAVLAASLAAQAPLKQAAQLANLAAGLAVAKLGTAAISVDELQRAVGGQLEDAAGVCTEVEVISARADARGRGERVVFTNGCFDLLHAGHVRYLQAARSLGDRLIVAVNSDRSVQRLKGPNRPIMPLEERMEVLAGLASVDWVVAFDEPTPERLIRRLLPDVLAKGGDYRIEDIVGGDSVRGSGGQVVVVDFVPGCSTTELITRIRGDNAG